MAKRLVTSIPQTPETEAGDDLLPIVRGWPDGVTGAYDPSAPGSIFSDYTANAGIRVGTNVFCLAKDFNFTHVADGTSGTVLIWKPPANRRIIILGWTLDIAQILLSPMAVGSITGDITVGIGTAASSLVYQTSLHQHVIPHNDASWLTSGANASWTSNGAGGGGVSNYSSDGGDAYGSDAQSVLTGRNGSFYRGRMSQFTSPWTQFNGTTTADRFVFYGFNTQSPTSVVTTYAGTARMVGLLVP